MMFDEYELHELRSQKPSTPNPMNKGMNKYFLATDGITKKSKILGEIIIEASELALVSEDDRYLCMNKEDWSKDMKTRRKIIDDFVYQEDKEKKRGVSFWSLNPNIDWIIFYEMVYSNGNLHYFPPHCNSIYQLRSNVTIVDWVKDASIMMNSMPPTNTAFEKAEITREVFYYLVRLEDMELDDIPL